MTRTVRSAAIAVLTALAAVAAIIAADLTAPISAQSGDTTGRIVARLLDDGRIEFGWQPAGGERVLPTQRYFPATIDHNRWLRSSPVEVDGAAIGRINARQAEDGRIEFAFTPTDRERILTDARYFPAGARAGRWLRSTEITITIGAPIHFIAVSAGRKYTCAIRESGELACWGLNSHRQTDAPDGRYTAVSASTYHTCAIRESGERESGELACWGNNFDGETDAPAGIYTAVSAGNFYTCAIHTSSGEIECWGWGGYYTFGPLTRHEGIGRIDAPDGRYSDIAVGYVAACAIRDTEEIACWGVGGYGRTDAPDGSYTAISAGSNHTCAIRESGELACWGLNGYFIRDDAGEWQLIETGQTDAPPGRFIAVSAGRYHTCAIRASGELACWGLNGYFRGVAEERRLVETGQTDAPEGSFTAVSAGIWHSCAIRASGAIECWGENSSGEATPPTD